MPYLPWVIHLAIWLLTMSNFWVLPWQGGHPLWMAPSTSRRKEPTSTNFLLNPFLHKGRQQRWWEKERKTDRERERVWQCGKMKCAMRRNSPALRERHVIFSHSRSFCKKSSHGNSWLTSMFIRASTEIWLRWASKCCSIIRDRTKFRLRKIASNRPLGTAELSSPPFNMMHDLRTDLWTTHTKMANFGWGALGRGQDSVSIWEARGALDIAHKMIRNIKCPPRNRSLSLPLQEWKTLSRGHLWRRSSVCYLGMYCIASFVVKCRVAHSVWSRQSGTAANTKKNRKK